MWKHWVVKLLEKFETVVRFGLLKQDSCLYNTGLVFIIMYDVIVAQTNGGEM